MPIHLTNLAEAIFTEMTNRAPASLLSVSQICELSDPGFVRSGAPIAARDARLRPYAGRAFDGACRVDVVLRLREGAATACELKLGRTRLTAGRVDREWLSPVVQSSHADSRWRGNIMAILERNFIEPVMDDLVVDIDGMSLPLTREWLLITRQETIVRWKQSPPSFTRFARFIAFEDLVCAYGGAAAFNGLVRELVSFDYCSEWGLAAARAELRGPANG